MTPFNPITTFCAVFATVLLFFMAKDLTAIRDVLEPPRLPALERPYYPPPEFRE